MILFSFANHCNHFMMAVSWGGHESLILPKCAGIKASEFDSGEIPSIVLSVCMWDWKNQHILLLTWSRPSDK